MSCKGCECVVGQLYTLTGGICNNCLTPATPNTSIAQYTGLVDGIHWFTKTNPAKCLGCGIIITRHDVKCGYGDRDLELEKFFGVNQPHWIGR